ncbi:LacI family transcriptional regulator [Eubacteriales bacterium OttesenSCG-928-A19]|nr:LacI family transcriptional regulator [Eubacteriales bacterium OttesenSCG-928-A19]
MSRERVTIRDIASIAGVSTATVSRFLNRTGNVEESTARRIADAIERTHYTPSMAASSLRNQKNHMLLLVVPDICNPFYSSMAKSVQMLANARGYVMALFDSGDADLEMELSAVNLAQRMNASGILFASIYAKPSVISRLEQTSIPAVGLNAYEHCGFDSVHVQRKGGTYLAMRHLIELGHTDIAFAGGTPGSVIAQSRYDGYVRGLRAANIALRDEMTFEMGFSEQDGYKAGCYFSTLRPLPTAICCANDLVALGVIQALGECGLSVPGDISVTGMDDIPYGRTSSPKLTTVDNDGEKFAREGFRMLFERIDGTYTDAARSLEIPNELIIRASTGAPAARP